MNFSFLSKTPEELQLLIAGRVGGEIPLLSLIRIAVALHIDDELKHLFEDVPPMSIEEVIRGQD